MKILNYKDMEPSPVTNEDAQGVTVRWLIAREDEAPNVAMRLFEVEPGGNTPLHTHPWEHEVFILDGSGVVWNDGDEVAVGPGTAILIHPGEEHCLRNTGEGVFRFICLIPVEAQ